jgi:hypothetical protein
MSRTRALGVVAAGAVVIVGALVAVSQLGSASSSPTSGGLQADASAVQREFHGIAQRGTSLGSRRLAHATPGLDGRKAFAEQSSPRVTALLGRARHEAGRLGATSTPSFFLVRQGRQPQRVQVSALTTKALSGAIALRA